MPDFDQIVIGRGASGLGFLHYANQAGAENASQFASKKTLVIGRADLWGKVATADPTHRFGQPAQIVSAPNKGTQATVSDPKFQTAQDISGDLRSLELELKKNKAITFLTGDVTKVDRHGSDVKVDVNEYHGGVVSKKTYTAKQVIVAAGFGPSQLPIGVTLPDAVEKGEGDWGRRVMGGTEYLYSTVKVPATKPFVVAVQGSSATSSWAVMRAIALGATHIYWISRSGFADANPAGRNSDVLKHASTRRWLVLGGIKKIAVAGQRLKLTLCKPSERAPREGKLSHLGEAYKNWYQTNEQSPAKRREGGLELKTVEITDDTDVLVDHYVYALGADPNREGGVGAILSPGIKNTLEPVFDTSKRFGDVEADATVALKSDSGDVWVVGAAVFRSAGIKDGRIGGQGDNFKNIGQMMSEAGTPPEGIAAVMASLKAVTGYYELEHINFQTADFKEIEKVIALIYSRAVGAKIPDKTLRVMTDQIVALRKHTVFGLSKQEVDNLNDPEFWKSLLTPAQAGQTQMDLIAAAS